jgi:hypothetical protein
LLPLTGSPRTLSFSSPYRGRKRERRENREGKEGAKPFGGEIKGGTLLNSNTFQIMI